MSTSKSVGFFGGGFKPPTKGHFEVVKSAMKQNPEMSDFVIYVGSRERNGIGQAESILIWEIYKKYLPIKTRIEPSESPIRDIIRYAKNNPEIKVIFVLGAREGREDDLKDISQRTRGVEKTFPNTKIEIINTSDTGISGTNARLSAKTSPEEFKKYLPDDLTPQEKDKVYDIIRPVVNEQQKNDNSNSLKEYIKDFTKFLIKKYPEIKKLPKVKFINGDTKNANDFLGNTAHYNPQEMVITLYTENRHPKDIVRSFSHEFIHHKQNLENRLNNINTTNTNEDSNLQELEKEAYLDGNINFRNWTDSIKQSSLNENQINFKELEKYLDEIFNEYGLDVAFSKHFKERVLERGITEDDIIDLVNKILDKYGDEVADLKTGDNRVFSHLRKLIDIAVVNNGYNDDYLKDLMFKTAYKRQSPQEPEFRTNANSPKLKVAEDKEKNIQDIAYEQNPGLLNKGILEELKFVSHIMDEYLDDVKKITNPQIKRVPLKTIIPSQKGEDYKNASSEYESEEFLKILKGDKSTQNHRKEDFYPILVNRNTNKIIDGNHRHYALSSINSPYAVVLYVDVPKEYLNEKKDIFGLNQYARELVQGLEETKIEESPDYFFNNKGEIIDYENPSNIAFGYYDGIFYDTKTAKLSSIEYSNKRNPYQTHDHLGSYIYHLLGDKPINRKDFKYSGRIFKDEKTISFWDYPQTKDELNKVINDINKIPGIRVTNNWFIDLTTEEYMDDYNNDKPQLVKISDYKTNKNPEKLSSKAHISFNKQGNVPVGVGSKFKYTNKKPDETVAQMHSRTRMDEEFLKISDIQKRLQEKYNEVIDKLFIFQSPDGKYLELNIIKIKPEYKNQGWATKILDDLSKYAQENNKILTLTPSDTFGADVKRLEKFYKRFGFVPNKGENRDYKTQDVMIRPLEEIYDFLLEIEGELVSLHPNENDKNMSYKIYCDMDGVLTDFDSRFEQYSDNIPPKEYEEKKGTQAFWDLIDKKIGVKFWVGMKWMPDGKELWDYISQYSPILLSAPSKQNESRLGKRLWVKNNTPGTKLILSKASNKKDYARKNAILIDDKISNINDWNLAGGIGILHTSTESTLEKLKKLGL